MDFFDYKSCRPNLFVEIANQDNKTGLELPYMLFDSRLLETAAIQHDI